uniref:Reverse transcriptase domain-containing protein n=1 Tax=Heterorhabditis bacteriophora TaxID=37862 RepID=A0A1I7X9J2_HETBA
MVGNTFTQPKTDSSESKNSVQRMFVFNKDTIVEYSSLQLFVGDSHIDGIVFDTDPTPHKPQTPATVTFAKDTLEHESKAEKSEFSNLRDSVCHLLFSSIFPVVVVECCVLPQVSYSSNSAQCPFTQPTKFIQYLLASETMMQLLHYANMFQHAMQMNKEMELMEKAAALPSLDSVDLSTSLTPANPSQDKIIYDGKKRKQEEEYKKQLEKPFNQIEAFVLGSEEVSFRRPFVPKGCTLFRRESCATKDLFEYTELSDIFAKLEEIDTCLANDELLFPSGRMATVQEYEVLAAWRLDKWIEPWTGFGLYFVSQQHTYY